MKDNINLPDLFFRIFILIGLFALAIIVFQGQGKISNLGLRVGEVEKRPVYITSKEGESQSEVVTILPTNAPVASFRPTSTPSPTFAPQGSTLSKNVTSYIPIYVSLTTTSTDWVDVLGSDFSIDIPNDYPTNAYITWEATLRTQDGSGESMARILNVTKGTAVLGSDISETSFSRTLKKSGKITMQSGNNTYRVQIKSKTSSPAIFDGGRVKIVY